MCTDYRWRKSGNKCSNDTKEIFDFTRGNGRRMSLVVMLVNLDDDHWNIIIKCNNAYLQRGDHTFIMTVIPACYRRRSVHVRPAGHSAAVYMHIHRNFASIHSYHEYRIPSPSPHLFQNISGNKMCHLWHGFVSNRGRKQTWQSMQCSFYTSSIELSRSYSHPRRVHSR